MPSPEKLTRHDRAVLLGLDIPARVTDLEVAMDDQDNGLHELAAAMKWQNRAIGSGLVTIIGILLGAVILK